MSIFFSSKAVDPTKYIDKIYSYDNSHCFSLHDIWFSFREDSSFPTGSAVEGAFICRGVYENKPNIEIDIMKPLACIGEEIGQKILTPMENVGFYHLRWNEEFISCIDPECSSLVPENKSDKEHLDSQLLHHFQKVQGHGKYEEGAPNIYTDIDEGLHVELDCIPCIELDFWPDFVHPWFERERYWPSPEIIKEIDDNKCHLVLKSTPGSDRNDEWRISFSKAEVILAKRKSQFQKKCYLLAKFIYYANLKQIDDPETGRHLSSYLLKTTMLHMLEQTPPEHWKDWEERKSYCQVVIMLYERLAESLSKGYLPSYFVDEINLLEGYSGKYLKEMSNHVRFIHNIWNTPKRFNPFAHPSQREKGDNDKDDKTDNYSKPINSVESVLERPEAKVSYCDNLAMDRNFHNYLRKEYRKMERKWGKPEARWATLQWMSIDIKSENEKNSNCRCAIL